MYRILLLLALACVVALPALDRASEPTTYRSTRQAKAATERRAEKARRDKVVVGLPLSGADASSWVVITVVVLAAGAGILFATRKPTR